jgi:predicted RNA-binding Zn-ribbon protein involved in translation (DUF1610 family)
MGPVIPGMKRVVCTNCGRDGSLGTPDTSFLCDNCAERFVHRSRSRNKRAGTGKKKEIMRILAEEGINGPVDKGPAGKLAAKIHEEKGWVVPAETIQRYARALPKAKTD